MSTARARLMRRARRYLTIWKENIGLDNELGLTDINKDAEDFCCGLLNIMLDAQLQNLNLLQMNFPAIDLADRTKRLCVQVTSTAGAEKITHTLDRFYDHSLNADYSRLIVLILGKKKNYRTEFPRQEGFSFDPSRDIWDIPKLLTELAGLDMIRLERVDGYLREQLNDLEELQPPMNLPVLSALDDSSFLGRERELADIARKFEGGDPFVILSGLGGIGKTELAARFANSRWGGESYLVRFDRNWKETVLSIASNLRGVDPSTGDQEQIYRDAMAVLTDRGADELLILDNVDHLPGSMEQLKRELSCLRMRILVTTRTDADHAIDVARLHQQELYQLFEQHDSAVTPEQRDALIDAVQGHTLTVDLMARALRRGRRRAATAEKLLKNLSDPTIRQVATTYANPESPAQAQIIEHLKVVFQVSNRTEPEKELLRCATLLPEGGMDDELFLAPYCGERQNDLDALIDNGWLVWKDGLLRIHPVIRKVCREELTPSDEACGAYLEGLIGQYDETDFRLEHYRQMAQFLTNASEQLEDRRGKWALQAGERWRNVGEWKQAQACSLRAMAQGEANLPPDHPELAQAYNNVGVTYGDLGSHSKALEYKLKALTIRERVLPPEHPDLAQSYNNVGSTYGDLGNHSEALKYKLKALTIYEKALPPEHPDLAMAYNNVGGTYGDLGNHSEALKYKLKALAIWEQALSPDHPDLALSYSNVALTYDALGNLPEAARHMQRAAEIITSSSLPKDHPRCVNYPKWADKLKTELKMRESIQQLMGGFSANPYDKFLK